MAITSIGTGSETETGAQLAAALNKQLADQIPVGGHGAQARPGSVAHVAAGAPLSANVPLPQNVAPNIPTQDVNATLWQEVASSDLSKLGQILLPVESKDTVTALDNLLQQAIVQVANGNEGRAVGLLADYATRDPGRAENLVGISALEPVRPQLGTLLEQMTSVARISAEDSLAKATHTAEEVAGVSGKLPTWDTKPEVLVKLAQRLYEAGGYANYAKTNELAKALTSDAESVNHSVQAALPQGLNAHGMHAMSAAQGSVAGVMGSGPMVPGVTVPYLVNPFVSQEINVGGLRRDTKKEEIRRAKAASAAAGKENWQDFKEVVREVVAQVWDRAPLLIMMLAWLSLGIAGGVAASLLRQISPDSALLDFADFGFEVWGIGFLALVGFGFVMRIRKIRF